MKKAVNELLKTAQPRERSGATTAARYAFQANFGILKLIDLLEDGHDFRAAFDLFDDLMILDCSKDPKNVRLIQIKSKDPGDWTAGNLCEKTGKSKPRSIVSRLYSHMQQFGEVLVETSMVSNAPFRLKLQDGTTTSGHHHHIPASELNSAEVSKITKAIVDDNAAADVPNWIPKLAFIRTSLGVHGQELVVIGRLQQHIESRTGGTTVKTSALYQTLFASIEQRTGFSEDQTDTHKLIARKSLTRSELETLLTRAIAKAKTILEDWGVLQVDFQNAGIGSKRQIQLKTAVTAYLRDRTGGRADANDLSERLRNWAEEHRDQARACESVLELASLMREAIAVDNFYALELEAASLVEAYEVSHEEP
jgi:hypothetical protein